MQWRTEVGRLFHSEGPETKKAGFSNFRFKRSTVKSPCVDDRSLLVLKTEHGMTMDAMYEEEVPE